jgi:hypothetical protein
VNRTRRIQAALLLLAAIAVVPLRATTYHPIAAVRAPNGSLFVLTAEDTVFAVNMGLSSGSVAGHFAFKTAGILTDMAYGEVGGQAMLFVSSSFSTGQTVLGRVQEFTTAGQPVQTWTIQHVVAGLTFDSANQTVYFTSGDSPEIYAIAPQPKSSPRYVAEVAGSSKLGAITVDPSGQQFYIADVRQGTIFSMSVTGKGVAQVGQVGTPQALLVDSTGQQLIVADSTRKQVVALSLAKNPGAPRVLAPAGSFQGPAGLAWFDASHLLVADQNKATVSLVDVSAARLLYSLPIS